MTEGEGPAIARGPTSRGSAVPSHPSAVWSSASRRTWLSGIDRGLPGVTITSGRGASTVRAPPPGRRASRPVRPRLRRHRTLASLGGGPSANQWKRCPSAAGEEAPRRDPTRADNWPGRHGNRRGGVPLRPGPDHRADTRRAAVPDADPGQRRRNACPTRSRATTVRLGEQSCVSHRTLRPSQDTASVAGHCVPRRTRLCPKRHSRGTLSDRVPRLFGSANSRASVTGHCVPRRTLRPSSDTTVPQAAQSWHPARSRATTVRLGEQSCVRHRTLRPSPDTTVPQAAQSWHPTRSRATTVRLGEQSCVPRRTLRPSPDTASLAGHCVRRRTRLCPKRHSRGTLSDRVPRLFGSANSRASVAGRCVRRRTLRPSSDTTVPQAAQSWHPARSRATTVRLGEQSCVRHRTLRPSQDTASLAGHDCAPSGTVVAPCPIACHDCSARRTVVRPSPDAASVAGHCVRRRTRLCPKRHSRGTLSDRVPRLFGSANSRASVTGHCVPRRTRLCPKRHSRGTRPRVIGRFARGTRSARTRPGACSSDSHHQAVAALASAGSPERARRRAAPRASICPGVCSALTQMRKYRSPGPPG